jgi:hypothetical protein
LNKNGCHLNEEQIIKAIVDKNGLLPSEKDHLYACPECRSALESFEKDLNLLGQRAEKFVPLPPKRTFVYEKGGKGLLLGWRSSLAAVALIIFFVISIYSDSMKLLFNKTDIADTELYSEEIFISEVNALVENPLPAKYLFVSDEEDTDYDEDFIDFVVPSAEDDVLSGIEKGGYIS